MTDTTTIYECQVCHARGTTPDAIRHQAPFLHPDHPDLRRLEFPVLMAPSDGLFRRA